MASRSNSNKSRERRSSQVVSGQKSSFGTLEVDEERLNWERANHDVVQLEITMAEALGVEFFNLGHTLLLPVSKGRSAPAGRFLRDAEHR